MQFGIGLKEQGEIYALLFQDHPAAEHPSFELETIYIYALLEGYGIPFGGMLARMQVLINQYRTFPSSSSIKDLQPNVTC